MKTAIWSPAAEAVATPRSQPLLRELSTLMNDVVSQVPSEDLNSLYCSTQAWSQRALGMKCTPWPDSPVI